MRAAETGCLTWRFEGVTVFPDSRYANTLINGRSVTFRREKLMKRSDNPEFVQLVQQLDDDIMPEQPACTDPPPRSPAGPWSAL